VRARVPLVAALLAVVGCVAPPRPEHGPDAVRSLRRAAEAGVLSYLRAGPGTGRRLVLVHGTPGAAVGWADYLVEPPSGLEVLAVDRPGFGESGPDGAVTSLEAQAEAVAAFLGPPDRPPAIVLGHSLGGAVAAWVAATRPERVGALVLVAASLDPDAERIHPLQRVGAWPPVRALLPRPIRNANAELMALRAELAALGALLPSVRAPVIILHGTRDANVPYANVAFARRRLTGACQVLVTTLDGADHFLPWNAEAAVRAAVREAVEATC
jgi:pimeloyl-ACP methyl ester carboxylesterase